MEYENVFALGPLCGVSDPDDVFAASARCDELGLDTISAGGTIAWAMECAERGLIDAPWLRFGDGAALLRALDLIGARTGLGELLAQGSRRAAEIVGEGSIAFAPQVKGLELPGTSRARCRRWRWGWPSTPGAPTTTAPAPTRPTFPVSTIGWTAVRPRRGGRRHRGPGRGDGLDDPLQVPARGLRRPVHRVGGARSAVTGWGRRRGRARATARRIVLAKRVFNLREGATAADDTLPRRLLETPLELGSGRTAALTEDRLRAMVGGYYAARGWDAEGRPGREDLAEPRLS